MAKAKFLADECTFVQTVLLMRKLGFDVQRIQQLGMTGAEDDKVFEKAQELKVVLVTNDKGSRKNKFTFLALRFRLGLADFKEQKAL